MVPKEKKKNGMTQCIPMFNIKKIPSLVVDIENPPRLAKHANQ